MQNKINGHDVFFGDVAWQALSPGDDWRKIAAESFEDEIKPKKTSLCKFGDSGYAAGSVPTKASGIPFGALFAYWCMNKNIPYAMYVAKDVVIAVIEGLPRIERYFSPDVEHAISASDFAANAHEVSFPTGCLIFGENDLSASTALSVEEIVDAVYALAKKDGFSFRESQSYTGLIAIILIAATLYGAYAYHEDSLAKERARMALAAAQQAQQAIDPVVAYVAAENAALVEITPKLCDGVRFSKYATVAAARTSVDANGWTWQKTDITCDSVVSTYIRSTGTNNSLRSYISGERYLVADFAPDMITATIRMELPQIKEDFIKKDFSVDKAAIPSSDFFFSDGSQMQIISDNVSVKFTISTATPIVPGDIPKDARQVKKTSFSATGDAKHWKAISQRFFEKEHFLASSMSITPERGKDEAIKFKMEGVYLVY